MKADCNEDLSLDELVKEWKKQGLGQFDLMRMASLLLIEYEKKEIRK